MKTSQETELGLQDSHAIRCSTPGSSPKGIVVSMLRATCTPTLTMAPITVAKSGGQPRCPSPMERMWHMRTLECCSATQSASVSFAGSG